MESGSSSVVESTAGLDSAETRQPVLNRLTLPEILYALGNPTDGLCQSQTAITISKYFAKDRQEQKLTYGELCRQIAKMADVYQRQGLGKGSKIALAETNSVDFFSSYFGGLAVGATMVPINLLALQDESSKTTRLVHMLASPRLRDSDSPGSDAYVFGADPMFERMYRLEKILSIKRKPWLAGLLMPTLARFAQELPPRGLESLVYKAFEKNAKTAREKADLYTLFQKLPARMRLISPEKKAELMATAGERWDWTSAVAMEQVADIVYTSGTSGNPKGVALTHGNLAFTVKSLTDGTEDVICNHDVLLMGLPFFHIFGKAVMLTALSRQLAVARQGGKVDIVILPSLSKAVQNLDGVIKTIHDYQVTILPSVPVFLEKLVEYLERHPAKKPLVSSLKTIISGGAALKAQTYDALKAINPEMRILEGYGSSEAGINLLNKPGISGFVGTPLPGVQTQLDVSGEDPTVGELLVKSDGVSAGYVLGTTESADRTIADAQGWFRTGDIVRHDPAVGYKIIGRDSFFIKIDNEKRSPEELEEAVRLASEAITDAMVVAHLAGSIHEQAVAVVTTEDTTLDEAAIKKAMDHLATKNQITRWKIPKHILVLHQPKMPERFDNGFKREAGYKVIRQFINEALALRDATGEPVVIFHEKSDTHKRPWTEIRTPQAYHELIQKYNTAS